MKKFLTTVVIVTVALSTAFVGAYAWFNASLTYQDTYTMDVQSSDGLTMTQTGATGKLKPVTGNATTIVDKDGNSTTDYYEVTYNVSATSKSKMYLNSITVNSELGKALRVQTTFNGSSRVFAPTGATTGYSVNSQTIAFDDFSTTLGILNGSGTLTVRVFLEGQDTACTQSNFTDKVNVTLNFEAKPL